MLLGSLDFLADDLAAFVRLAVVVAFSLIVAITIHEFSHALVASGQWPVAWAITPPSDWAD